MRASPKKSPRSDERYKPLVLCGPSGAGKSTLTEHIMAEDSPFKNFFAFSVSSTTRAPRPGEKDGVHYHFTTKEDFQADIEKGNFLEHNEVHGNFYGTHKSAVREIMNKGKICILDIDVKGAMDIASKGGKEFTCNYVFVQTHTVEDLKQRLIARGTETEDTLNKRVSNAEKEMKLAHECNLFKKFLINDDRKRFTEEAVKYVTQELYHFN
jgi:guanylate kinase